MSWDGLFYDHSSSVTEVLNSLLHNICSQMALQPTIQIESDWGMPMGITNGNHWLGYLHWILVPFHYFEMKQILIYIQVLI